MRWGFWLVLVWFAETIWITAVVTLPCCQTGSDIGELFLDGLLWVVSVRVLKAQYRVFSPEKMQRVLGGKRNVHKKKKDVMLQFPSGLFRSELELFSVWDLRKFAFSSQARFFRRWWAHWIKWMKAALRYDSSSKPGASQRARLLGIETERRHIHKWSSVSLK